MNPHYLTKIAVVLIGGTMLGSGLAPAQERDDTPGAEVLTRGPVHEAFAGTVNFNPEAGIIIDQSPPTLIEEVPPEQRLEGNNVAWIPGYWAWDEDQGDFLWISGIWRNLPPGREWIPGYWAEVGSRQQWTSGYWEDARATSVSYLPEPPRSLESGPNIAAASNNQSWIPGNWIYRESRYAWRAGYWNDARENWSWTPAYYRWTRRGYVYVDGYWDYPVVRRGVVFAPVHFDRGYVSRPGFYYSPLTVIALSVFTNHLFLRPNYGHYYFGDYYEPRYRDRGFYASFSYSSGHRGYDPIFAHDRWENRNDRNWDRQRQDYFEYRRDHAEARPPRTWAALSGRSRQDRDRGDFGVADRFDRVVENHGEGGQRFQKVDAKEREKFVSQRQEIRKFGKQREQQETTGERAKKGDGDKSVAVREKIDRSPLANRDSDRSDKDGGPPERLQPRMSEKDQGDDQPGRSGKGQKSDREDPAEPMTKETADRKGDLKGKDKDEPKEETRTKPGQKRDAKPDTERETSPGGKGKSQPAGENPNKFGEKRDPKPDTNREGQPNGKGKGNSQPAEENRTKPGQKREAKPDTERKATPAPRREEPAPERKAKPEGNRQNSPAPERKATPAPQRKSDPSPERKAKPQDERKAKNPDNRDSAAAPNRKATTKTVAQQQAPKRQQQARPEPKASRKSTTPSAPVTQPRKKSQPAAPAGEAPAEENQNRKNRQKNN